MKTHFHYLALGLLLLTGCAHIPPASVDLSRNIGSGMAHEHRAYVGMINLYFDQKREAIDQWIEKTYTPTYLATVRSKLAARNDPNSFDDAMMNDIIQRIVQKRDTMQAQLEKARTALLDRVESNHALLLNANNQLTALLQSAVKVQEADSALIAALKDASGGKIDFAEMDTKFNGYLERAGDVSKQGTSLYDELQPILQKP